MKTKIRYKLIAGTKNGKVIFYDKQNKYIWLMLDRMFVVIVMVI